MNDTNPTAAQPLDLEALDRHLDAVLRASGSALRHYTMQKTLDDMRAAMSEAMTCGAQARAAQPESATGTTGAIKSVYVKPWQERESQYETQEFSQTERMEAEIDDLRAQLAAKGQGEPVAWIRFCSDGCYEGPIMHSAMEEVRKKSGAWSPLYLAAPASAQPADRELVDLLKAIRPQYGAVGSRDVDVAAQQKRIDRAVELLERSAQPDRGAAKAPTAQAVPMEAIGKILAEAMARASANGANSVSMPDEYVAIAHFVAYPEKYATAPANQPEASPASQPVAPTDAVLVPRTITEDMHVAAVRVINRATGNADWPPMVWDAMLAAAPVAVAPSDAKGKADWVEDFQHENGNYQCICCECGQTFFGHKRRVVCKVCATAGGLTPDVEFKRLADTILQATTNGERLEALRGMAELLDRATATSAADAKDAAQWMKTPPTEQADYWNWDGDPDHAPMIYHVLWSGTAKKCFVSAGQYGIDEAIWCDSFGGWWLEIEQPPIPSGDAVMAAAPSSEKGGAV